MATKLSTEVTATTGLPAPSSVSAAVISPSEISVSWTNNDDSPDGGIDVERRKRYVEDGQTAHFTFDTTGDGTVEDIYNGNDAPITGTTASRTGIAGDAWDISGTNTAYANSPESLLTPLDGTDGFTITYWAYHETLQNFGVDFGTGTYWIESYRDNSRGVSVKLPTASGDFKLQGDVFVETGEWEFIAVVYRPEGFGDDTTFRIYRDDKISASANVSLNMDFSTYNWVLGNYGTGGSNGYVDGLDEFRFFGRGLSDAELSTLRTNPDTRPDYTTVTSGLSPSTTSYTDTSVVGGNSYDYRIERNTDHATATSAVVTQRVPKTLSRSVNASTTAATTVTRALTAVRGTASTATTTTSATRRGIHNRSETADVNVTATTTRSGIAFTRQRQTTTTTTAATTRSVTLPRTVTDTTVVDTAVTRDRSLPRQVSSDTAATAAATVAVHDVFPTGLQEHELIYDPERALFHTGWFDGERVRPDASVVAVRLAPNIGVSTVDVAVEIDTDGDGTVDRRSPFNGVTDENIPRTFTTTPREDERMRIAFKNVRFDDIINQVNTAVTTR